MNSTNGKIRFGQYIDGTFYDRISKSLSSDTNDGLDIKGVEGISRYNVAKHKHISIVNTDVTVREYFRGQFSAAEAKAHGSDVLERDRNRELMFRHHGYKMNLLPMRYKKEKGVDVALTAQMLLDAHHDRFDCAVLFSGDRDFIPLVSAVKWFGKEVVIFDWDCWSSSFPPQKTSPALVSAASWPIDIMRMIERPDADDRIYVDGLFLKPNITRTHGWGAQPRKAQPIGASYTGSTTYQAVVTHWGKKQNAKGFGYARLSNATALPCGATSNNVYLLLAGMLSQGSPPNNGDTIQILSIAPNPGRGYEGSLIAKSWSIERRAETQAAA